MSNLFASALLTQSTKRAKRLTAISESVQPITNAIAVPSGFDAVSGLYTAQTIDGGEIQYRKGSNSAPPNQISVTIASGSLVAFGDWL
jgi:hypothetical protein